MKVMLENEHPLAASSTHKFQMGRCALLAPILYLIHALSSSRRPVLEVLVFLRTYLLNGRLHFAQELQPFRMATSKDL